MKFTKSQSTVAAVIALAMLLAVLALKAGMLDKVADAAGLRKPWTKFQQKFVREGLSGVWEAIRERLDGTNLVAGPSVKYSLYEKASYPPLENPASREALAEYKVVAGLEIEKHPASRETGRRFDSWHRSHGDDFSSKYSSLDQIDPGNVAQLEVAWTYGTGSDLGDVSKNGMTVETNPIIANGRLFVPSIDGRLIAIDAATGREIWRLKLPAPVARRGMIWEPNEDFARSRLFVPAGDGTTPGLMKTPMVTGISPFAIRLSMTMVARKSPFSPT